jgi:hypothetical protein
MVERALRVVGIVEGVGMAAAEIAAAVFGMDWSEVRAGENGVLGRLDTTKFCKVSSSFYRRRYDYRDRHSNRFSLATSS